MSFLTLGAFDISGFCNTMKEMVQIIGYVILIFKVAIPLLIIGLGVFDFGKAVVAEKEEEIKKQTKRLIFRVIAGVVIFMIPSIVTWLFGAISGYSSIEEQASFDTCEKCFLTPWNC